MGEMVNTQVVMDFARNTPADQETLEHLAEAALEALHRDARFVAFGPVVSVNFERSAVEVECTVCTETGIEAELDQKVQRLGEIVLAAFAAADYQTSTERIPVPA